MARRRRQRELQLVQLQAQTRAIRSMNRLLFAVAGLGVGCVVVATWFPQQRQLARLELKLAETERQEKEVLDLKNYREAELKAMRESPEYIELKAMDRLNLHHEGDKVYRIRRDGMDGREP